MLEDPNCYGLSLGVADKPTAMRHRGSLVLVAGLIAALALWAGCDRGLDAEAGGQAGIAGRVHFTGAWPVEIGQVAVAVYRDPPSSLADFFNINGWDTGVALGASVYDYYVPLDGAGEYRWIIVAWRREDSFWDFTSLLGCYHLPGAGGPTAVRVEPGAVAAGIDIEVDFAALDREAAYGTALCERVLPAELFAGLGG